MSGWLTSASDTNKVVDSEETIVWRWSNPLGGSTSYIRKDKLTQYRYTGMTLSAAQTTADTLNAPPDVVATVRRSNEGGGYEVHVSEITEGEWEEVVAPE
jgi:hypothetical protein